MKQHIKIFSNQILFNTNKHTRVPICEDVLLYFDFYTLQYIDY